MALGLAEGRLSGDPLPFLGVVDCGPLGSVKVSEVWGVRSDPRGFL